MAFDMATAKPASGGFDISTAKPMLQEAVTEPQSIEAPQPTEQLPEGGLYETITEPLKAIASGAAGSVIGGLTGAISAPFVGTREATETIQGIQAGAAEMGAPETQAGQRALKTVGDLVQTGLDIARVPLSGLGGLAELLSGQGPEQAAQTVKSINEKGLGPTMGERAFEITGDPLMATVAAMAPDTAMALFPVGKIIKKNTALRTKIADQIKAGGTDKKLATYMINGSGKLKGDPIAKEAINQGFDQSVIAAVKGASPADKAKMLEMTNIMKKGKENALFVAKGNRPSNVAGNSLLDRVNHIKNVNTMAGKELDGVAKSLKGQPVDFSSPINSFMDDLGEMGITLDKKLKPVFKGSDIEGLAAPENAIKHIVDRLSGGKRGVVPDAYELHRMKKYIDEIVTYGKQGEGLAGKTERVLKKLRRNLDTKLDESFPEYNTVNTTYADTVGALDALQDVAGKKMDLFGPNAEKATGTLLRRMMSNAQSRVNLVDAVDGLEETAKKYGAVFDDDIATQMLYADELDSVFGPVAKTSLAGETAKGLRKGAETATGARTMFGTASDVGEAVYKKVKGATPEKAFQTIEELLSR